MSTCCTPNIMFIKNGLQIRYIFFLLFIFEQNFKLPKNLTFFAPKDFKFFSDSLLDERHKSYKLNNFFDKLRY